MTIDKAIELLTYAAKHNKLLITNDEFYALQLGIEALKRCKVLAANSPLWAAKPLPGETECWHWN